MRLERIEEICLDFLRNAVTPMTEVSVLYDRCLQDNESDGGFTLDRLTKFLRDHAEVMVVEMTDKDNAWGDEMKSVPCLSTGPSAILKSRIPSRVQAETMLRIQAEQLREKLLEALEHAKKNKDTKKCEAIKALLERAERIEDKIEGQGQ